MMTIPWPVFVLALLLAGLGGWAVSGHLRIQRAMDRLQRKELERPR